MLVSPDYRDGDDDEDCDGGDDDSGDGGGDGDDAVSSFPVKLSS